MGRYREATRITGLPARLRFRFVPSSTCWPACSLWLGTGKSMRRSKETHDPNRTPEDHRSSELVLGLFQLGAHARDSRLRGRLDPPKCSLKQWTSVAPAQHPDAARLRTSSLDRPTPPRRPGSVSPRHRSIFSAWRPQPQYAKNISRFEVVCNNDEAQRCMPQSPSPAERGSQHKLRSPGGSRAGVRRAHFPVQCVAATTDQSGCGTYAVP